MVHLVGTDWMLQVRACTPVRRAANPGDHGKIERSPFLPARFIPTLETILAPPSGLADSLVPEAGERVCVE